MSKSQMEENMINSEVAQADVGAGFSPQRQNRIDSEDAFMEASSQFRLKDDDSDVCCGFFSNFWSNKKNDLTVELLSTPLDQQYVDNHSSSNICCCNLFGNSKTVIPVRVLLPRLSSNILGMRQSLTPGSSRVSESSPGRGRSASAISATSAEHFSLSGGTIPRAIRRSGSQHSGTNIEVVRKIVMLGARHSGKTSVITRFAQKKYGANYDPTIETTIRAKIALGNITFLLDLLDTAGQDETSNFSRQATVGVHGYCMIFSVTSMQSFIAIQKIRDRIVDLVGLYTVPSILVGTKSDDETRREVQYNAGESLADSWGTRYVECSAKSNFGIDDIFVSLLFEIERDSGLLISEESEGSEASEKNKVCRIS